VPQTPQPNVNIAESGSPAPAAAAAAAAAGNTDVSPLDESMVSMDVDSDGAPIQMRGLPKANVLEVKAIKAQNLRGVNSGNLSDPYVSIICEGLKLKTKHLKKTVNPEWNQQLLFPIKDVSSAVLEVHVKDHEGLVRNKPLGMVKIPVAAAALQTEPKDYEFEDGFPGSVTLAFQLSERPLADLKQASRSSIASEAAGDTELRQRKSFRG
jgi:hypothetical protein